MSAGSIRAETLVARPPAGLTHVAVHPLVIMNMSDHWTRSKAATAFQQPKSSQTPFVGTVLGVILGQTHDAALEMVTSCEVAVDNLCESECAIRTDLVKDHMERLQEVLPGLSPVGWYTCGSELNSELHGALHDRMAQLFDNEALLWMMLDPAPRQRQSLPVYVFQSSTDAGPHCRFASVTFHLESDDIELIGVEAARTAESQHQNAPKTIIPAALRVSNAIQVLVSCLDVLNDYLVAVEEKRIATPDAELLRRITTICRTHECAARNAAGPATPPLGDLLTLYLGVLSKATASTETLLVAAEHCGVDVRSTALGSSAMARSR